MIDHHSDEANKIHLQHWWNQGRNYIEARGGICLLVLWPAMVYHQSAWSAYKTVRWTVKIAILRLKMENFSRERAQPPHQTSPQWTPHPLGPCWARSLGAYSFLEVWLQPWIYAKMMLPCVLADGVRCVGSCQPGTRYQ